MPNRDVQITLSADPSGLLDGIGQAHAALAGLGAPLTDLQAAFAKGFDAAPADAWSASLQRACENVQGAVGQTAAFIRSAFTGQLDPVGAVATHMFAGVISGTESVSQAFLRLGEQMLSRFAGYCTQMAAQWALKELTQTTATTVGAASRGSAELAAHSAGMSLSASTALADIGNSAARAAAGAYAAVAATPIIGPALAPAASAAALAAVLAMGANVFSAAGGWGQVPYDGAFTALHQDEMVLPASLATPLRSALSASGEAGGTFAAGAGSAADAGGSSRGPTACGDTHHHWNISAVDAQSFARLARDNPAAITGALTAAAQRLGLTGGMVDTRGVLR